VAKGTGGDGGIRTLDRALQPYNGLANRRLQPLGHVSNQADMPDAAASRKRLDFGRSCAPVFAQFRRFGTGIFWLIPPTDGRARSDCWVRCRRDVGKGAYEAHKEFLPRR
jgi:hypothetical protein